MMKHIIGGILALTLCAFGLFSCKEDSVTNPGCTVDENYKPVIDPANFVTTITEPNPYFLLTTGRTLVYEGENEDGETEHIEVVVTDQTKTIMGITCIVVHDVVSVNGQVIEDTYDWYAQDKTGNVWYFGEDVKDYEDGELVSTAGSWEAGVDGALPGVRMPAHPFPGHVYRQEYYACEAEDMAQDIKLDDSVSVPHGNFGGCLKTLEWNPFESGVTENKWYAPGVGNVKEVNNGTGAFVELIDIR